VLIMIVVYGGFALSFGMMAVAYLGALYGGPEWLRFVLLLMSIPMVGVALAARALGRRDVEG
jgi:hypothetical protein